MTEKLNLMDALARDLRPMTLAKAIILGEEAIQEIGLGGFRHRSSIQREALAELIIAAKRQAALAASKREGGA